MAHENAQIISEEIRKKSKSSKDFTMIEILDFTLDVISLGMGKLKALREMKDNPKANDDDDWKGYMTRVVNKLDKLAANF